MVNELFKVENHVLDLGVVNELSVSCGPPMCPFSIASTLSVAAVVIAIQMNIYEIF